MAFAPVMRSVVVRRDWAATVAGEGQAGGMGGWEWHCEGSATSGSIPRLNISSSADGGSCWEAEWAVGRSSRVWDRAGRAAGQQQAPGTKQVVQLSSGSSGGARLRHQLELGKGGAVAGIEQKGMAQGDGLQFTKREQREPVGWRRQVSGGTTQETPPGLPTTAPALPPAAS